MTNLKTTDISTIKEDTSVAVAIAVIHYSDQYLLSFRHANQHQGNRYEFVGGKVEHNEHAKQALIREVKEEVGLLLNDENSINALGILHHTYSVSRNKSLSRLIDINSKPKTAQKAIHTINSRQDLTQCHFMKCTIHSLNRAPYYKKPVIYRDDNQIKTLSTSKTVCLHVYRVGLSHSQFHDFSTRKIGLEGQKIEWVHFTDLIANRFKLPDANTTILQWLRLPDVITITYDVFSRIVLDHQNSGSVDSNDGLNKGYDNASQISKDDMHHYLSNWVTFHSIALHKNACVYVRTKAINTADEVQLIIKLIDKRPDLKLIISTAAAGLLIDSLEGFLTSKESHQIIAQHITQSKLNKLFLKKNNNLDTININLPITISCHDIEHIDMVNKLAQYRQLNKLPPVIGIFLSPVKATSTHPKAKTLGWEKFNSLACQSHVPIIALGGLAPNDLSLVRQNGGDKIAGISRFISVDRFAHK